MIIIAAASTTTSKFPVAFHVQRSHKVPSTISLPFEAPLRVLTRVIHQTRRRECCLRALVVYVSKTLSSASSKVSHKKSARFVVVQIRWQHVVTRYWAYEMESRDELIIFHACRCLVSRIIHERRGKSGKKFFFVLIGLEITSSPIQRSVVALSAAENLREMLFHRENEMIWWRNFKESRARMSMSLTRMWRDLYVEERKDRSFKLQKKSGNLRLEWLEMSSGSISKLQKAHFYGKNRHHHWISIDFHGRIPLSPKNLPQLPRDAEIEDLNLILCEQLPTLITARSVGVEVSGRAVQYSSVRRCKDKKGEKKRRIFLLNWSEEGEKVCNNTRIEIKRQKNQEVSSHHKGKVRI